MSELRDYRNRWAHQENFSSDDAYRALDSASRLLAAVSAPQSEELEKFKMDLLRVRLDEQARGERRKQTGATIKGAATGLKRWREVVTQRYRGLRAGDTQSGAPAATRPRRFHGTVSLDAMRVGLDASLVADEVIAHLTALLGAKVTVTLEVEAEIPDGAPDQVVRTVTENSLTLKFTSQGFQKE